MVSLLQLLIALLLLSVEDGSSESELVPASIKVWNLTGAYAEFINSLPKTIGNTDCFNQENKCSTVTSIHPSDNTTNVDLTATTDLPKTSGGFKSIVQCNKAAHYDKEKQHCVCNNPEMDGKKMNPEKYSKYSEGEVCYSCQDSYSNTAVVFILDNSGTVKNSGWEAQKVFMRQFLDLIGDIKVGIVVITGASYVAVPLDDYKKNKELIENFIKTEEWGDKWTAIGVALYQARKMLEDPTLDSRNIIIFSDGDKDVCSYDDPSEDCPKWKKDNITAHPQKDEAMAIHKMGINVTYLIPEHELNELTKEQLSRIITIAGKPENVITKKTFTNMNKEALSGVVTSVCKEEKLIEN